MQVIITASHHGSFGGGLLKEANVAVWWRVTCLPGHTCEGYLPMCRRMWAGMVTKISLRIKNRTEES